MGTDKEMKEVLNPNMFRRPEEPKIENYYNIEVDSALCEARFQKDHDHWKFITGPKPPIPWIRFEDSKPKERQRIEWKNKKGMRNHCTIHNVDDSKWRWIEYWADKSTYDKTLKEWQDNQIRFEGFYVIEDSNNRILFQGNGVMVSFQKIDSYVKITSRSVDCNFMNGCPVDLFEKLLEIKER